jgi:hypothetical protein
MKWKHDQFNFMKISRIKIDQSYPVSKAIYFSPWSLEKIQTLHPDFQCCDSIDCHLSSFNPKPFSQSSCFSHIYFLSLLDFLSQDIYVCCSLFYCSFLQIFTRLSPSHLLLAHSHDSELNLSIISPGCPFLVSLAIFQHSLKISFNSYTSKNLQLFNWLTKFFISISYLNVISIGQWSQILAKCLEHGRNSTNLCWLQNE